MPILGSVGPTAIPRPRDAGSNGRPEEVATLVRYLVDGGYTTAKF